MTALLYCQSLYRSVAVLFFVKIGDTSKVLSYKRVLHKDRNKAGSYATTAFHFQFHNQFVCSQFVPVLFVFEGIKVLNLVFACKFSLVLLSVPGSHYYISTISKICEASLRRTVIKT